MKTRFFLAAAGILLAGIAFALFVCPVPLRTVTSHFAGTCRALATTADTGNIALDPARGFAYVSYVDRSGPASTQQRGGTVMLVDLNVPAPRVRAALLSDPPNFRPAGLSLYVSPEGARRLFVVDEGASAMSTATRASTGGADRDRSAAHSDSSSAATSAIVIFEQGPTGAFVLTKMVRDPLLSGVIAIVAVGPDQFYFTRDSDAPEGVAGIRELLLRPSHSSVLYYDGRRVVGAATGLQVASSLARSADGTLIYVSEMTGKRLRIYQPNENTGALRERAVVPLDFAPTGLSVDAAGTLWIVAQPGPFALVANRLRASIRVPTQVLTYSPGRIANARLAEIYTDDGNQLSAGTAVAAHGKRLLIGGAANHQLQLCEADWQGARAKQRAFEKSSTTR